MKKTLAILIAILMVFTLFACKNSETTTDTGASSPAASTEASASSETAPDASAETEPSTDASRIGYYDDSVDWYARDPYKIIYIGISLGDPLHASLNQAFKDWSGLINVDYSSFDCNFDYDIFMVQLETYATQDYDGFIFDVDYQGQSRIMDICEEYDLTWMPSLTAFADEDGHATHPYVQLTSYDAGRNQAQWLFDNYKDFIGEVDPSDIAFMTLDWSGHPDIHGRSVGAGDCYKELYPELYETNFFNVDLINEDFNAEAAYNVASATISANAHFDYWLITGSTDDFSQGAALAAADLIDDRSVVVSSMGDTLINEWKAGYEGNWAATVTLSQAVFAEPVIFGLIAMLDGRVTADTLWSDSIPEGEAYGVANLGFKVYTIDNYNEYQATVAEYVAATYPDLPQLQNG